MIELNALTRIESEILSLSQGFTMCSPLNQHLLMESTRYVIKNKIHGDIVECGVWRGGMMQIAARTILSEFSNLSEDLIFPRIWLYDTFEGMPYPDHELDRDMYRGEHAAKKMNSEPKIGADGSNTIWCVADIFDVKAGMASTGYPSDFIHYIEGMVENNLPNQSPEKISILRVDTDWYSSTKHIMHNLFEKVVKGGIIIFDDYESWEGARTAVNEFFKERNMHPLLIRLDKGRVYIKS
jgi:hypothetical protein